MNWPSSLGFPGYGAGGGGWQQQQPVQQLHPSLLQMLQYQQLPMQQPPMATVLM